MKQHSECQQNRKIHYIHYFFLRNSHNEFSSRVDTRKSSIFQIKENFDNALYSAMERSTFSSHSIKRDIIQFSSHLYQKMRIIQFEFTLFTYITERKNCHSTRTQVQSSTVESHTIRKPCNCTTILE